MLEAWSPEEKVRQPTGGYEPRLFCSKEFCRYFLGVQGGRRGSTMSTPLCPPDKIRVPEVEYFQLKDLLSKQLMVRTGLFRKFSNQRLEELAHLHKICLDAVDPS
jgi:hypothetical protein